LHLKLDVLINLLKHFHPWMVTLLFDQGSENYIWTHSSYCFGSNLLMFWKLFTITHRWKNLFFCGVWATIFLNQRCSSHQLCKQ
jgi:hypothetical protein